MNWGEPSVGMLPIVGCSQYLMSITRFNMLIFHTFFVTLCLYNV